MKHSKKITGLISIVFISVLFAFFTACNDINAYPPDESEEYGTAENSIPASDSAGIFHVSTDGSDESGTGSERAPFATIQHAVDAAVPGYTIIVKEGTYTNQGEIRIEKKNITIKSQENRKAIIKAPISDENIPICFWFTYEASGCKLIGLDISGGYYYGIKFDSDWDWDRSLPYDRRTGASDILLDGCSIHDTGADAVKITPGCDDITIRNCEIYNSGLIIGDNAEGIDNVNGDRMRVENCYIHDIATNGIYFKGGATGCVVEKTRVERCGEGGIFAGFDTSIEWFDLDANPEYYEAIDGTIQNCIVQDTVYAGIALYASKNTQIINNTIIDTASEGHSPIYFGISFQDWEPDAGRPANAAPVIMNNIICQPGSEEVPMISIRYSDELGGLSALDGAAIIDCNCYYTAEGEPLFEDNRIGMEYSGLIDGWRTHLAADMNSLLKDPLLDDTGHLKQGSPCIDMGSGEIFSEKDYDDDERQSMPDIGADEYMSQ